MSAALIRLMNWLSPVFPTGGFAYSGGLEQAVRDGLVSDEETLRQWLVMLIGHGTIRNDLILMARAFRDRREGASVDDVARVALALCGSAQRRMETVSQGAAFAQAVRNWPDTHAIELPADAPLPVVAGAACQAGGIALDDALAGFAQAFVSNQLQAAIRLSVTGQTGAARLLAGLEPVIAKAAAQAREARLDDLGSAAFLAEVASLRHETLDGRLFRS